MFGDALTIRVDRPGAARVMSNDGLVIGPHDGPVVNKPLGETYALGIVTTPIGCGSVLGVRPAILRGAVVELRALGPAARDLRSGLIAGQDPEYMLDRLEKNLVERCSTIEVGAALKRCEEAVGLVDQDPRRRISDVSAEIGVAHPDLDRMFTRRAGLTPRALARIAKLRRLISHITGDSSPDWAALADEYGWFDQAHLIRDFKRHTGVTPTGFVASQRAMGHDGSSHGSGKSNPSENTGVAFVPD